MRNQIRRRDFLKSSAAFAALGLSAGSLRAASPNGKLRTAHIGVGGMGGADLAEVSSHPGVEVAALCDVDSIRLAEAKSKHPQAETFRDFRDMFDSMADRFDAVVVSTPDHTHAPAAMTALNNDKPVYCQKPLTHEVYEARQLRKAAAAKNLPTQMGIQIHSAAVYRRAVKMIQDGVIGKVSAVHAWSGKNWGYDGPLPDNVADVPDSLAWDLWLGTAKTRQFIPNIYHPGAWRKMVDFGTGTLGDMGVHIFDTPFAALELTAPNWVKTTCRPPTGVGHPEKNIVRYEFPGTKHTTDTMTWTWYDGSYAPPKSDEVGLPSGMELPGQASLFIGEGGQMLLPHTSEAQLFPEKKFSDYKRPEMEDRNHYHEWVDACMGNGTTSAGFEYACPLTEALLLGVVANRFPDKKLTWNAEELKVTNLADANELIRGHYREGFEVEGL